MQEKPGKKAGCIVTTTPYQTRPTRDSRPDGKCVPQERRDDVDDLFQTWDAVRPRNLELRKYYTQHNELVGISNPKADDVDDVTVEEVVGWAKEAVDSLAMRSILDGFLFEGEEDKEFSRLVRANALDSVLYPQACVSALTYGVGWFTVMRGNRTQPKAFVRCFSGEQAAGIWDKDECRLKCGAVLNDVDREGRARKYTFFWPDEVIVFERHGETWDHTSHRSDMGTPLMVPMVFQPDADRPLGHSRITPEIMRTIDRATRQLRNLDIGCESYVWPQRWMMGVDEDLFEEKNDDGEVVKVNKSRREVYGGKILALTRDLEGNVPNVGEFSQADVSPIIRAYEQAAQQMSGATHVPVNELGVLSSNYTSSEALQASTKALCLDVELMNRQNARTLEQVALMMMAISENKRIDELTDVQRTVMANFRDPSMPTAAAMADANMKIASMDESYRGSRSFYRHSGWSEAEIDRFFAEKRRTSAIQSLVAIGERLDKEHDPESGRGGER